MPLIQWIWQNLATAPLCDDDLGGAALPTWSPPVGAPPIADDDIDFQIEEDAPAPPAALALKLVSLPSTCIIEEDPGFTVEDDTASLASAPRAPAVAIALVDEGPTQTIITIVDEDACAAQTAANPLLTTSPSPAIVDELAIAVDEEILTALAAPQPTSLHLVADQAEETTVVEEECDLPTIAAPRPATLYLVVDQAEEIAAVEEEFDLPSLAAPRPAPLYLVVDQAEEIAAVEEEFDLPSLAAPRLAPLHLVVDQAEEVTAVEEETDLPPLIAPQPIAIESLDLAPEEVTAIEEERDLPALVAPLPAPTSQIPEDSDRDPPGPEPPAPPAPAPEAAPAQGGGGPWADRSESNDDFLEDVARIRAEERGDYSTTPPQQEVSGVEASNLVVDVGATMMDVRVVERGNFVFFVAHFDGDPDEVHFAHTRPGENRPMVDPGCGQPGSGIERIGEGAYFFKIDTTGFRGGTLRWHFWGRGWHQASQFGEVEIPDRPPQLL